MGFTVGGGGSSGGGGGGATIQLPVYTTDPVSAASGDSWILSVPFVEGSTLTDNGTWFDLGSGPSIAFADSPYAVGDAMDLFGDDIYTDGTWSFFIKQNEELAAAPSTLAVDGSAGLVGYAPPGTTLAAFVAFLNTYTLAAIGKSCFSVVAPYLGTEIVDPLFDTGVTFTSNHTPETAQVKFKGTNGIFTTGNLDPG